MSQAEFDAEHIVGAAHALGKMAAETTHTEALHLGYALILARLADAEGMTVEGVCSFPAKLIAAGLPAKPDARLLHEATKLNRDAIDACAWRCNAATWAKADTPTGYAIVKPAPKLTRPEVTAAQERKEQATKAAAAPKLPTRGGKPMTAQMAEAHGIDFEPDETEALV